MDTEASTREVPVKKVLIGAAVIAGAALCAGLVRLWLPVLARLAGRLSNSLSALRRAVPASPMPGNPVPGSPDSEGSRSAVR
jgi:hypothetical protein